MLFTPMVVAEDGQKMGKSRNNTEFADIAKFIKAVDGFKEKDFVLTEDLIQKNVNEKKYSYIL